MSDIKQYYEFVVKQTSKGVWYCDKLSVIGETVERTAVSLDEGIKYVEGVLKKNNEATQ